MDERKSHSWRVMWLLVAGLFAGICYTVGFNAGCDEGEGRLWRRHIQRIQEAAEVQGSVDRFVELATRGAETTAVAPPTCERPTGVEAYADLIGGSVQPAIAARGAHDEAF